MGIATTYSIHHLTPAATLHPSLDGYYLTPETVKPIQALLDATTGTEKCVVPWWEATCWTTSTQTEARDRMARFLTQMDTTLNPHRLLLTADTEAQQAVRVLDPRIREVVGRFLPTLPSGEKYGVSDIQRAADQLALMARQSGLELFAQTSPCHTSDPRSLTCTWSNLPGSVDEAVWLKPGDVIHPKLAGTYFTQRAAAGLRTLLQKGETPAAQETLAELVLKIDKTFSPYCMPGYHIVMDGSVAAVDSMIDQNLPAHPGPLTEEYTRVLHTIFDYKGVHDFPGALRSQMLCDVQPFPSPIADVTFKITCGYVTTAADVL